MSSLITGRQAFERLCRTGELMDDPSDRELLDTGLSYVHPTKGTRQIVIDTRLLGAGKFYVPSAQLATILKFRGAEVGRYDNLRPILFADGLTCGFAGFASAQANYKAEGKVIQAIFETIKKANPVLIVDGGAKAGVLGFSGVLAAEHRIPSLGVTPLQGLKSFAPRNHHFIWGNTYQDREQVVGTLAKILFCIGGGDGTRREAQAAIKAGNVVVLLSPKVYGSELFYGNHHAFPDLMAAKNSQRLFTWQSGEPLLPILKRAIVAATHQSNVRKTLIRQFLGQS